MKASKIARVGVIAAAYAALTILLAPLSYGMFQVRVSEALTVLPFIFPESVLGLFIGCLLANIYGGYGALDIVLGSFATLAAAYLTRRMPLYLAPLPPVIINAVAVAVILKIAAGNPFFISALWVGAGELAACYGLGLPLLFWLKKYDWP